jgi:ankyrin repeat protein
MRCGLWWNETTSYLTLHLYLTVWQEGNTALIQASMNGHLPVCELLVEKGANKEAKGKVSGERCKYLSLVG